MKPSKTDHDQYSEVTAADLLRGIVRKGFQPISAGPDAPEYFKSVIRRAGGLVRMDITNPRAKQRTRG